MISFVRRNAFELLLSFLIIGFIVYFSFIAINRFHTYRSNYFDLGIMDQVVYNTSQGRFLEMTNQELRVNVSRFAIHFDPLLAFFAPIYVFYAHPNVLLVAQVAIIGIGAFAIFLIAKLITKSKLAAFMFALSFLFYHPIQRAIIFDFHSVVFATTFLLYAIYFSLKKKYLITLLFVFLALLTKEHVGLITFFFGSYIFLFQKERKYGFIIAGISLLFFVATFFYIIPTARMSAHFALQFFEDVGGDSPSSVALNIIKNPMYIWEKVSTDQAQNYIRGLFFPHLVFILFAPLEFLIALPELAINLLSSNGNMRMIYFHYNSVLVPFIYFSTIVGYNRMRNLIKSVPDQRLLTALFICTNLYFIYRFAPLPVKFFKEPYFAKPIDQEKMGSIKEIQNMLADESTPISTTPQLAPFFTRRQYFYNLLYDSGFRGAGLSEDDIIKDMDLYKKAQYIVIATWEVDAEGSLSQKFYKNFLLDADYKKIYEKNDIMVYRKQI